MFLHARRISPQAPRAHSPSASRAAQSQTLLPARPYQLKGTFPPRPPPPPPPPGAAGGNPCPEPARLGGESEEKTGSNSSSPLTPYSSAPGSRLQIPPPLEPEIDSLSPTSRRSRTPLPFSAGSSASPLLPALRAAAHSLRSRWRAARDPRDPPAGGRAGDRVPAPGTSERQPAAGLAFFFD